MTLKCINGHRPIKIKKTYIFGGWARWPISSLTLSSPGHVLAMSCCVVSCPSCVSSCCSHVVLCHILAMLCCVMSWPCCVVTVSCRSRVVSCRRWYKMGGGAFVTVISDSSNQWCFKWSLNLEVR